MDDPYDLQRFVDAQDFADTYLEAVRELRGQKRSHWMWFVFLQVAGLGHSPTAQRFAGRRRRPTSSIRCWGAGSGSAPRS